MPETTRGRKAYELATAIIHRKDGSCRRILKQKDENGVVSVLMDKFFLPGTFVTNEGEIISGPGECKRWTQSYSFKELAEIALANAAAKVANLRSAKP